MINFYFADLAGLVLSQILNFFLSLARVPILDTVLTHVAHAINHMILTSGAAGALPLWLLFFGL